LLPAFLGLDLGEVLDDLRHHGHELDLAWFEPFLSFRFPRLGEVDLAGVHLELHQGLEPWHVLGEETTSAGTSRYVDSSVERVQVSATGLVPGRHLVTCNGVPVPLRAVHGDHGPVAGGVRYRAWSPPSGLHPTIGVHSPLVFDLVDLWNGRSLGGFTYHVVHPGGRSYDRYPVNAAEAESRRAGRFVAGGHTAGRIETGALIAAAAAQGAAQEYSYSVDLRRHPGSAARDR